MVGALSLTYLCNVSVSISTAIVKQNVRSVNLLLSLRELMIPFNAGFMTNTNKIYWMVHAAENTNHPQAPQGIIGNKNHL